ncbi:hypothetical protein ACWGK1_27930 [Streptomyces wedmorensis]
MAALAVPAAMITPAAQAQSTESFFSEQVEGAPNNNRWRSSTTPAVPSTWPPAATPSRSSSIDSIGQVGFDRGIEWGAFPVSTFSDLGVPPASTGPSMNVAAGGSCADSGRAGPVQLLMSDPDDPATELTLSATSKPQQIVRRAVRARYLAAQRRERARGRGERNVRWGGRPLQRQPDPHPANPRSPLAGADPALLAKAKGEAMGGAILYMWLTMSATHLVLRLRREREAPYLLVARMRGLP